MTSILEYQAVPQPLSSAWLRAADTVDVDDEQVKAESQHEDAHGDHDDDEQCVHVLNIGIMRRVKERGGDNLFVNYRL